MNRSLKIFITISVLLNLLFAGIIIGDIGRCFMGQNKHLTMHDLVMALPADKREHLKETTNHSDQDIAALRQQLNDERKKAANLLKTDPFDKDAYVTQMQAIQQLKIKITLRMTDAVIGLATQATPQERAAVANILFPKND